VNAVSLQRLRQLVARTGFLPLQVLPEAGLELASVILHLRNIPFIHRDTTVNILE
jgi:hypothetical protein